MRYSVLAFEFVGLLGIFGFVGMKVDDKYGSQPWGLLVGLLIGMGLGLYTMVHQLEKLNR